MTELALTAPRLQQLFREVDLAPLPRKQIVRQALDLWHEECGDALAPNAGYLWLHWPEPVRAASFLAAPVPGDDQDFILSEVGSQAGQLLNGSGWRLADIGDRQLAVRLRHLFRMVIERGEAIGVEYSDGCRTWEVLAAPLSSQGSAPLLCCTLACEPF